MRRGDTRLTVDLRPRSRDGWGLRNCGIGADDRRVAERKESPPVEQSSLSGRMRDLIMAQTVEERRKRREDDDAAGSSEKRRRRDDRTTEPAKGDS